MKVPKAVVSSNLRHTCITHQRRGKHFMTQSARLQSDCAPCAGIKMTSSKTETLTSLRLQLEGSLSSGLSSIKIGAIISDITSHSLEFRSGKALNSTSVFRKKATEEEVAELRALAAPAHAEHQAQGPAPSDGSRTPVATIPGTQKPLPASLCTRLAHM